MSNKANQYDVIIIGSGIGGSAAGVLLSRYFQKRVLILEKHWQFGGLTHEFTFDGKSFATGLHYIGSVNNGSVPDKIFQIITDGQVSWLPMPHRYDEIIFPEYSYSFPASTEELIHELSSQFPTEKLAIEQFVLDIDKAFRFLGVYTSLRSFGPRFMHGWTAALGRLLGFDPNISLKAYLDERFQHPTLKSLLASQWCDHGVLPSEASFMVHAMIVGHYIRGAYYPEGGPTSISQGMMNAFSRYGGTVLLNTPVLRILTKGKRAYGVEVKMVDGSIKNFYGDNIISNAGAVATYQDLLPQHHFDFLERFKNSLVPKHDFFSIYLSLKESPEKLGFDGSNKWIFRTQDHSKTILHPKHPDYPGFYCLLFPSLKAGDKSNHTMEVLTLVNYQVFRQWEDSEWKQRATSYYDLKEHITSCILQDMEKRYPGIGSIIEKYDSSTPLTTKKFLSRAGGASYGIPFTTERPKMEWLSNRTPIQNLYLSGQDALGPGVMGAMMGGVGAAAKVLGVWGYLKIMAKLILHQPSGNNKIAHPPLALQVHSIKEITPEAYTIEFEPHKGLLYKAGQFLVFTIRVGDKQFKRSYSLSSTPDDLYPAISIKRIPKGVVSNYLGSHLQPGDELEVSLPKGSFFISKQDREKDLVMVAAGSGITPIFSIIKDALSSQVRNRIHLFYATQTPELAILKGSLEDLAQKHPTNFQISYCYSQYEQPDRPAGRLQAEELLEAFNSFSSKQTLVYACAPGALVKMLKEALDSIGFPEEHFHFESFSAAGILNAKHEEDSMEAQLTFRHKGSEHKAHILAGEPLLTAIRRERMPIEYSCMSGDCELCKCQLMSGEVVSVKGRTKRMLQANNSILPCISYAKSKELLIRH